MEAQKSPLSIRIIYWLTNFASVLYVFVSVLLLTLVVLQSFGIWEDNINVNLELPLKLDILNEGMLNLKSEVLNVEIVEAQGKIHFIDTSASLSKWLLPVMFITIAILGYLIFTFRKFIVNVKHHVIFDQENVTLMKRLAYGLVGMWFVAVVYARVFYYVVASNMYIANVKISSEIPDYFGIFLAGLFTWMFAHIFKVGLDLQNDKELTI